MSFKLKKTKNNPNPIEFKKEIEILDETTFGQVNNYIIPFKKEPIDQNNTVNYSHSNHEGIKQLESENNSLKSKINDLNEIIQAQSNEINGLKLRLNKYESNHQMFTRELGIETSENNKSEELLNLDPKSNHNMSLCESDTDSDLGNEVTSNKVIVIILIFIFKLYFKYFLKIISRNQTL